MRGAFKVQIAVHFIKLNGRWRAHVYREGLCMSWQTPGTLKNVKTIIDTQLSKLGIPHAITQPGDTEAQHLKTLNKLLGR